MRVEAAAHQRELQDQAALRRIGVRLGFPEVGEMAVEGVARPELVEPAGDDEVGPVLGEAAVAEGLEGGVVDAEAQHAEGDRLEGVAREQGLAAEGRGQVGVVVRGALGGGEADEGDALGVGEDGVGGEEVRGEGEGGELDEEVEAEGGAGVQQVHGEGELGEVVGGATMDDDGDEFGGVGNGRRWGGGGERRGGGCKLKENEKRSEKNEVLNFHYFSFYPFDFFNFG